MSICMSLRALFVCVLAGLCVQEFVRLFLYCVLVCVLMLVCICFWCVLQPPLRGAR